MKPSEGEILFKDKSITGQKSSHIVNAGVVLVPEGRQILQDMTVREIWNSVHTRERTRRKSGKIW